MADKEETAELIKKLVLQNKKYSNEEIKFTDYCTMKMQDRGIEKSSVIEALTTNNIPYYAEKQNVPVKEGEEVRYKIVYKISSRYSLIIIVVYEEKVLKVINVIKTSKSAEKLWRKKISR